jgi:hypothetical protein
VDIRGAETAASVQPSVSAKVGPYGAGGLDHLAHASDLVARQVVHRDDVAGLSVGTNTWLT